MQEATPLGPASNLPQSFLLKCLEQVRKIQADVVVMQERLVSERGWQKGREGTGMLLRGYGGKRTQKGMLREKGSVGETSGRSMGEERHGEMEESRLAAQEPWKAGKKLEEENFLGMVLGGTGWDGMGLRGLAGHGGRGRPQRDGEEHLALSHPQHSASFSSPVCHPQAVPP